MSTTIDPNIIKALNNHRDADNDPANNGHGEAASETARSTSSIERSEKPVGRPVLRTIVRTVKGLALLLGLVVAGFVAYVAYSAQQTSSDIADFTDNISAIGAATPSPAYDPSMLDDVPAPVADYFEFTFVGEQVPLASVEVAQSGDFRRPLTEGFQATTAEQTIAVGTPALMFSARTPILPGVWAAAYDHYAEGEMEMKAKLLSTFTLVDETETPELNQTSLQRWLLEAPMYPAALLPGGPVRWEPVSDTQARAIVSADGQEASLIATFRADGSLESFMAEEDGDLDNPYHGSGEHVLRSDYREVDGVMVPHGFTISRAAGGELFPFWSGEIESVKFIPAD
jgi:hypothetical protein